MGRGEARRTGRHGAVNWFRLKAFALNALFERSVVTVYAAVRLDVQFGQRVAFRATLLKQ